MFPTATLSIFEVASLRDHGIAAERENLRTRGAQVRWSGAGNEHAAVMKDETRRPAGSVSAVSLRTSGPQGNSNSIRVV